MGCLRELWRLICTLFMVRGDVTVIWGRHITPEPSTEGSAMAQPWADGTRHSSHTWSHTHPFLTPLARYFPPFHMYSMATVHSSSFTLRTNTRYWMTPKLSWRLSPFCDCVLFTWQCFERRWKECCCSRVSDRSESLLLSVCPSQL